MEGHRRLGGPPTGAPLWSHGAALAEGRQVLAQDPTGVLNAMAKEIDRAGSVR